jgi:hypothetical protein
MAATETFNLNNGSSISGEVTKSSFNKDGVMVRLADGKWTSRVKWKELTKETLLQLAKNKDAKPYIPPELIEVPIEIKIAERREAKKITIHPVESKIERPAAPSKLAAIFYSPVTLVLFVLMYGANIYAGYEVAIFKNRPMWLVCGTAALLPILGNVLFFALPQATVKSQEDIEAEIAAETAAQTPDRIQIGGASAEAPPPPPEEEAVTATAYPPTVVYAKGQFIINRRFFESKFNAYFKPTPDETEKDMLIIIKSSRGEFVGSRLGKAEQNEVTLLAIQGAQVAPVAIPYVEITQIILKHRDAPH